MTTRVPADIEPYLRNDAFHPQLRVRWAPTLLKTHFERWRFLLDQARGRSVVHIGCLDHETLVAGKIAEGSWLHSALSDVASRCVGVDVDAGLVAAITERYGVKNLVCCDLTRDELPDAIGGHWDLVMMPDVLEHIAAPVAFLGAVRKAFGERMGAMVITVPNAFAYENFRRILREEEWINSDHMAWYSPFTLSKVLSASGWTVREMHMLEYNPLARTTGVRSLLKNTLLRRCPGVRDTIGCVCVPAPALR